MPDIESGQGWARIKCGSIQFNVYVDAAGVAHLTVCRGTRRIDERTTTVVRLCLVSQLLDWAIEWLEPFGIRELLKDERAVNVSEGKWDPQQGQ